MAKKTFVSALFTFAFFPSYDKAVEFLAERLADPEDWDFSDASKKTYSILKNYLEHTFRKVQSESKIAYTQKNDYACFNTGLVTKNLEPIYALFEAYKKPKVGKNNPQFCFKAFVKESDIQFLKVFPDNHPEIGDFFQKPEDLIFNPSCKLIPQIDHIIGDNLARFPAHIQALDENERRRRLEGAIEEVKKRVKTNYKLARIPVCNDVSYNTPSAIIIYDFTNSKIYVWRPFLLYCRSSSFGSLFRFRLLSLYLKGFLLQSLTMAFFSLLFFYLPSQSLQPPQLSLFPLLLC